MKAQKTECFIIKRYANGEIRVDRKSDGHNFVILSAEMAGELADGLLAVLTTEERIARIPELLRPKPKVPQRMCWKCHGSGYEIAFFHGKPPPCSVCGGRGTVDAPDLPPYTNF